MSGGWIKWEKDLKDDPRVIRMASRMRNAVVTHGEAMTVTEVLGDEMFVALTLGGLSKLWGYADTHVRNDDTIELGIDDINKVVGIKGFAQFLPEDWLQIIDPETVKLPGFHVHNGTVAKKKALTQKRVAKHRENVTLTEINRERKSNAHVTQGELPDQDLDLDKTREEGADVPRETSHATRSRATRLPDDFVLTPERMAYAKQQKVDPQRTFENFRDYWTAASGAKARKCDWDATWRMWCRREQSAPTTNGGSRFQQPAPNHDAAWSEARTLAKEIGFRAPFPTESASVYATEVRQARDAKPMVPLAERRGLAGVKRIGAT